LANRKRAIYAQPIAICAQAHKMHLRIDDLLYNILFADANP